MAEKRSPFRRVMEGTAWASGWGWALCILLHRLTGWQVWDILAITAGTTFFHVAVRLAVGNILPRLWRGTDPSNRWFREKPWEKGLYRRLAVRRWKGHMPTYDPEAYRADRTPEERVRTMCISEVIHEIHAVLSLLPMGMIPVFGAWPAFVLTSLAACALDTAFAVMQRFNRPRVMRAAGRRQAVRPGAE